MITINGREYLVKCPDCDEAVQKGGYIMGIIDEYCECGNHFENCTCERCDFCRKYYPQQKLYMHGVATICEDCQTLNGRGKDLCAASDHAQAVDE